MLRPGLILGKQSFNSIEIISFLENSLRWYGPLHMDQKVCLNLVKKDQMCAIALMNRKWIVKALLKMVAMQPATAFWGRVL